MFMPVYLDNAATTRPCPEAVAAITDCLTENYGNASSLHGAGVAAWQAVNEARKTVARALSCEPERIVFTSGATESNNLALFGAARARRRRGNRIVTTAVEHPSVGVALSALEKDGFEVVRIGVGPDGLFDADAFEAAVDENTILCSCMLVNNETGAVLPVGRLFGGVKRRFPEVVTHCDAVQAFGKLPVSPGRLSADLLSVSGHKLHAAKGVGVLYIAKDTRIPPMLYGGGQERGMRPGTESVPLIAGFGAAVRTALPHMKENLAHCEDLRAYTLERLAEHPEVVPLSTGDCSPYILSLAVPGVRSEIMLHFLESEGVYVSSGSACSKGKKSGVLGAFGHSDAVADTAIRVSFSRFSTREDVDALAAAIGHGLERFRHIG